MKNKIEEPAVKLSDINNPEIPEGFGLAVIPVGSLIVPEEWEKAWAVKILFETYSSIQDTFTNEWPELYEAMLKLNKNLELEKDENIFKHY